MREVIALHIDAAEAFQIVGLSLSLHAFRYYGQPEPMGHTNHRAQDIAAARAVGAVAEEFHVELEDVHSDVLQRVERGISAAEIVHFHGEAGFSQRLDRVYELLLALHISGFRNFQPQRGDRQFVFSYDLFESIT
ncbi:hypothetical protein SDC9_123509 [bioreactor metagenome]|uniref:Uncharacterized protein n=1 Tax=bioreactor metagenome TaxID=1076179 RepID=A0A645CHU6_9ZZZZ